MIADDVARVEKKVDEMAAAVVVTQKMQHKEMPELKAMMALLLGQTNKGERCPTERGR